MPLRFAYRFGALHVKVFSQCRGRAKWGKISAVFRGQRNTGVQINPLTLTGDSNMPTRFTLSLFLASAISFGAIVAVAQDSRQLPANHLSKAHPRFIAVPPHGHRNPADANGTPGADSLRTCNASYKTPGFDPNGKFRNTWFYNMVGNPPQHGGTTNINAPVVPVALDLLNPDGSVFLHYDPKPFILPTLQSPLFQNSPFTSSPAPTQIALDQSGFQTARHDLLKQLLEQFQFLKTSVPILRERGVMRDLLIEAQSGKPAPRQMHAQFLDQLALTGDAV